MLADRIRRRLAESVRPGASLLVAVSGGADSIALAHLLKSLSYPIVLGHVNHQLRSGAAADERFVRSFAKRWDVPVDSVRVPVRTYAARHRMGLEEAGRHLRYKALVAMARRHRCAAVVTAHHADDQAETVLMNVLRGAGPSGLSGIAPSRALASTILLVRPCLEITRKELRAYLKAQRVPFRLDPTNRQTVFLRNRIRRRTLPSLEKDHPGLAQRLAQTADVCRLEEAYWQPRVARAIGRVVRQKRRDYYIDLDGFLGYHKALGRRMLHVLWPGLSFQDIERLWTLARSSPRGRIEQIGGLRATRQATTLVITTLRKP